MNSYDQTVPSFVGRAACSSIGGDIWFPDKGESTREAKKVCADCEAKPECSEWAITRPERFGIWGGLSEEERRRIRTSRGLPQPASDRGADRIEREMRAQRVRDLSAAGLPASEVADRVGLSERHVMRVRRAAGIADEAGAA